LDCGVVRPLHTGRVKWTTNRTKLPKVFALLRGHGGILLGRHKAATKVRRFGSGSRSGGAACGSILRCGEPRVGTTLLGVNSEVGVDVIHPAAVLGSTNLTNRKLTVGILLRQFQFILASLSLFATNLTKLLTVGLNGRQSAFANRANQTGVARASDAKTSLDQRHVDGLTPTSGRINALFAHTVSNAAQSIREKGRILTHEFCHRR
jgi:hypothetical protein